MKIALLGCKGTTLDLLAGLRAAGVPVDRLFSLPAQLARRNGVAFYRGAELEALAAQQGIPVRMVHSYGLSAPEDESLFRQEGIDLLLVLGWERLIPRTILGTLGRFACGMHGSPFGLPRGRGRSPLNWSLITGHSRFVTYLFRYTAEMDAGDILGFRAFEINGWDTIASLHMKNRIAMQQLVLESLERIRSGELALWPQPSAGATYYPKRRPEDGLIDWRQKTAEIHALVRALAPPYPPAHALHGGTPIEITEVQPFDAALFPRAAAPGTVLDVSRALGEFVVQTGDGSLLVRGFAPQTIADIRIGERLEGGDAAETLERIRGRYPEGVGTDEREI